MITASPVAHPPSIGADLVELGHDRRAAGAVDRPVDASAAGESRIGGVDDDVGGEAGDVALFQRQGAARDLDLHPFEETF